MAKRGHGTQTYQWACYALVSPTAQKTLGFSRTNPDRTENKPMEQKHPFTFDVYQSESDGAWIIHIETPDEMDGDSKGPSPLRVLINDGDPIYENPALD